jgi:predicted Rdx family selenoprotein
MPITIAVGARSLFVTATAWVFIMLGVMASLSALVQNAMLASLLPVPANSGVMGLLMNYLPWVVGIGLVISLATLASAIGLLLRLDWARRTFITLLAIAIVANLLGLWLQQEMMQSVVSSTLGTVALPPQALGVFGGFVTAVRVMAVVVTLGACALLAWIIRRLMSPGVRQEFA